MSLSNALKQILVMRRERKEEEKRIKREEKEALRTKNKINSEYRKELLSIAWKIFRNKKYEEQEFGDLDPQLIERIKIYGNAKQFFGLATAVISLYIVWIIWPYLDTIFEYIGILLKPIFESEIIEGVPYFSLLFLILFALGAIYWLAMIIIKPIKFFILLIKLSKEK